MMWLTASSATTMSPMLMDASSEPAMPVLSSAPTPKRSTSTCAHVAALTMPTPHCTTMTVALPMVPTLNSMPAMRVIFTAPAFAISSRNSAISTSMAPMMPMVLKLVVISCFLIGEGKRGKAAFCGLSTRPLRFVSSMRDGTHLLRLR